MYNEKDKKQSSSGHDLAYRLWITKGSRFVASERCTEIADLSNVMLAFLSVEVIAINLASLTGLLEHVNPAFITSSTLVLSISILVFGVFENAKDYKVRSLKYHSCALEINQLYSTLKQHLAKHNQEYFNDMEVVNKINEQFESILAQHENHQSIDFQSFLLDRHKDFSIGRLKRWEKRISIYYSSKLLYHALILLGPLLALIYMVFYW